MTSKLTLTSLGSGGRAFKWADSVLVQALQAGHWLLIDNVNFCRYQLFRENNMLCPKLCNRKVCSLLAILLSYIVNLPRLRISLVYFV
ncbi:hypothetical protein CI610_02851 [invertebrate metagenome]|uniref:Uncharacterized protein n=1 Tax=invertebrate metagenome TaxID=1711999 RepID=A0A2H9T4T4_9ZZZZ